MGRTSSAIEIGNTSEDTTFKIAARIAIAEFIPRCATSVFPLKILENLLQNGQEQNAFSKTKELN